MINSRPLSGLTGAASQPDVLGLGDALARRCAPSAVAAVHATRGDSAWCA
jgi:hypothetical protein